MNPKHRNPETDISRRASGISQEEKSKLTESDRLFVLAITKQIDGVLSLMQEHGKKVKILESKVQHHLIPQEDERTERVKLQQEFDSVWDGVYFITADKTVPTAVLDYLKRYGHSGSSEFLQTILNKTGEDLKPKFANSTEELGEFTLNLTNLRHSFFYLHLNA